MSKKEALKEKKARKHESEESEEEIEDEESNAMKPKKQVNEDGEEYWELCKNKRLSVSTFKGTKYVNLR